MTLFSHCSSHFWTIGQFQPYLIKDRNLNAFEGGVEGKPEIPKTVLLLWASVKCGVLRFLNLICNRFLLHLFQRNSQVWPYPEKDKSTQALVWLHNGAMTKRWEAARNNFCSSLRTKTCAYFLCCHKARAGDSHTSLQIWKILPSNVLHSPHAPQYLAPEHLALIRHESSSKESVRHWCVHIDMSSSNDCIW